MSRGRNVVLFCLAIAGSSAVPTHYFDEIDELMLFPREAEIAKERQAQVPSATHSMNVSNTTTVNATTTRAPELSSTLSPQQAPPSNTTTLTTTTPQTAMVNATSQSTSRPPQATPNNATTLMTTRPPQQASVNSTTQTTRPPQAPPNNASTMMTTRPPQPTMDNSTTQATTRPPQAPSTNATTLTTTRPPQPGMANSTTQATTRPPQAPSTNATTLTTTRPAALPLPAGMLTTRPPIASPATTTARPNQMVSGNCTLGDDILHVLFNRTSMELPQFTLENSLGVVGSRLEIINAIMNNFRNHTLQEIEACLDLYRIPTERPVGTPEQSASSHLIYHRPGHLGGSPSLPVPQPPSSNFIYGHGYTTYLRPFNVAQRVPGFRPAHRYLRANSLQDLFQMLYTDFTGTLNLYWQHGTPAYWFDRNAAPRRPG